MTALQELAICGSLEFNTSMSGLLDSEYLKLDLRLNRYDNTDEKSELFSSFADRLKVERPQVASITHVSGPPDHDEDNDQWS